MSAYHLTTYMLIKFTRIVDKCASTDVVTQVRQQTGFSKKIEKPVRPTGFKLGIAVLFVGMFVIIAVGLGVVFSQASSNGMLSESRGNAVGFTVLIILGLPLPSRNKIVQNILENYIPTATVMVIEPMWILINRYLCLLQPFEELRKGPAKAKASIDVNYSSLPPQLVLWKSLKAGHLLLTTVCTMALLSNLLAVAFSGLFHHKTTEVRFLESFQPHFDATFVSVNGSIGPSGRANFPAQEASGAYNGGDGQDQFLIAESNYSRKTPLPAWTDDTLFYVPFKPSSAFDPESSSDKAKFEYEAETTAFGSELTCGSLEQGSYHLINSSDIGNRRLGVTLSNGNTEVSCRSTQPFRISLSPLKNNTAIDLSAKPDCETNPSAAELMYALEPLKGMNASQIDRDTCWGTVVLGWARSSNGTCAITGEQIFDSKFSSLIQCRPQLVRGRATVRVDGTGRLSRPVRNRIVERGLGSEGMKANFENDPVNLISQSNRYLFATSPLITWHTDKYPSDPISYFMGLKSNGSRLLDPKADLPTLEDIQRPLNEAYSNLFAIWLGANHRKLFANASGNSTTAWRIEQQERIFVSVPLFGISMGILLVYTIVSTIVYLRRPGQFLPRLPTSIASIIGLFAASTAVHDMRGTSRHGSKERERHLKDLDARYGYGNYVGIDGKIHVGIEKTPFVMPRQKARSKKYTWGPKVPS